MIEALPKEYLLKRHLNVLQRLRLRGNKAFDNDASTDYAGNTHLRKEKHFERKFVDLSHQGFSCTWWCRPKYPKAL